MRNLFMLGLWCAGTAGAVNLSELKAQDVCLQKQIIIAGEPVFEFPLKQDPITVNPFVAVLSPLSFRTGVPRTSCRYWLYTLATVNAYPGKPYSVHVELALIETTRDDPYSRRQSYVASTLKRLNNRGELDELVKTMARPLYEDFLRDWTQAHP